MGIIVSLFGGVTGRTDDPHPVTGLTSRDVYLIQTTWADIRKEPTKNGVAILMAFLEKYPEYKPMFPFKDLPNSELPTNKKFQAHCNSIIYAFNSIIDNLNDPEVLANLVTKVGENHKRRNVPINAFVEIEGIMAEIMKTIVSAEAYESWKKVLKIATQLFEQGHRGDGDSDG